jgi:hypothetical protein
VERGELLDRLRERLKALEGMELRSAEDLLRASIILQCAERDVEDYMMSARRYELFDVLRQMGECERALYATYAAIDLNGGGEGVIAQARKDLEEAREALRRILAIL